MFIIRVGYGIPVFKILVFKTLVGIQNNNVEMKVNQMNEFCKPGFIKRNLVSTKILINRDLENQDFVTRPYNWLTAI